MAKGYADFGDPEAVVGRSGDKYGSYPGQGTTCISRLQSELANAELKKSRGAYLPVIDHPPTNLFDPGPTDQSLPGSLEEASTGTHSNCRPYYHRNDVTEGSSNSTSIAKGAATEGVHAQHLFEEERREAIERWGNLQKRYFYGRPR